MGCNQRAFRRTRLSVSIFFSHEIFFFALLSASCIEPSSGLSCLKKKGAKIRQKEHLLVIDVLLDLLAVGWQCCPQCHQQPSVAVCDAVWELMLQV